MARYWQPKYRVICECGWKGLRTKFNLRNRCPKCNKTPVYDAKLGDKIRER